MSDALTDELRRYGVIPTMTDPLRAAQRSIVAEWLDEGHESGRMEYDDLLDRLALAAEARPGLDVETLAVIEEARVILRKSRHWPFTSEAFDPLADALAAYDARLTEDRP